MVPARRELVAWERAHRENATPIGFIPGFGGLMGLIVGMVIIHSILLGDIAGHLREFAALKASGRPNLHLSLVVPGAAPIRAARKPRDVADTA
jgi:putative ABC transport system permease protein